MYYAHSLDNGGDKQSWQTVVDHARATADLAATFAAPFQAEAAAGLAGWLHDVGKYQAAFQRRLEGSRATVDHAGGGARVLLEAAAGADRRTRMLAGIIAQAIAGHHGGLSDPGELALRLAEVATPDPAWREEIPLRLDGLVPSLAPHRQRGAFQLGFFGRMLFSCLVDADFKDTERFYAAAEGTRPERDWPTLAERLPDLLARLGAHFAGLDARGDEAGRPVNQIRREVLAAVRSKAAASPGLFTLTVPTGGGKTLASLAFALDHARAHGLRRIVYALPYTSVIDQTAALFRRVLGEDVLLEHHGAIETDGRGEPQQRDKLRLAMEDWAAPVIVTTTVQLFESLFANRPGRCRKLHALAGAVIVLDEAQTLPLSLLLPCVAAIDELARNYRASVVLCTATQPALDRGVFQGGDGSGLELEGRELAPDPARLASRLQRVTVRTVGTLDDDALLAELAATPRGLVIVNSRRHALTLTRAAEAAGLEGVIHLTTRLYPAHRRRRLDTVRERLGDPAAPCRVIATSLVEAGVDLDFPRVWRAEAGLDQIAQAAGRCNREGRRPPADSLVTVFAPAGETPPPEIAQAASAWRRVAARHTDPLAPAALDEYFQELYWQRGKNLDRPGILAEFKAGPSGALLHYRAAADKFRMIESGLAPVIIGHDEAARAVLERLGQSGESAGGLARQLQPFLVQVPPRARARLLAGGHVRFAAPERFGDQFAVLTTPDLYHPVHGLLWEDPDYLTLEQTLIF